MWNAEVQFWRNKIYKISQNNNVSLHANQYKGISEFKTSDLESEEQLITFFNI